MPGRSRRTQRTNAQAPQRQEPQRGGLGGLLDRGNDFLKSMLGKDKPADPMKLGYATDNLELLESAHAQCAAAAYESPENAELHGRLDDLLHQARASLAGELDQAALEDVEELIAEVDDKLGGLVAATHSVVNVGPSDNEAEQGEFDTLFVNGAGTGLSQSMRQARALADIRNTEVGLVHNEDEGIVTDFWDSLQQGERLEDGATGGSRESETLTAAIEGSMAEGRQVDVVAHSQGSLTAGESLQTLTEGKSEEELAQLNASVHLNALGGALSSEDGELAQGFTNATFIDEREDWVSNGVGGRKIEEDDFEGMLSKDDLGGLEHLVFDDQDHEGLFGMSTSAHRTETYLGNSLVQDELRSNPFAKKPTS